MPNNLFFSVELSEPEDRQEKVNKAIQSLGNATPLTELSWYVNSPLSAQDAVKRISGLLTDSDVLVVADTTNDESVWFNLSESKARRVAQNWKM